MRKILLIMALALIPSLAFAQDKPRLTGDLVKDVKGALKPNIPDASAALGGDSNVARLLAKPFNDLADFINSDAAEAAALAIAIPDLQDGHGQQCWLAMGQFTAVLKAHPIPITFKAMSDLEALRLASIAANKVCSNPHCTQVFADLSNGIQQVAPINAGIAIPSLNSLCSKVPQVPVVAPVTVPTTP